MSNFSLIEEQTSASTRKIISVIIFAFLITFVVSRVTVYLVLGNLLPNFFLTVGGVHIHHFTYGVTILGAEGLYLLIKRPKPDTRIFTYACLLYGIGLGLTFDEFGMWIRLQDDYWVRQSYDAVIIILLLLFNIAYFRSIKTWIGKEASHLYRTIRRHFLKKNEK